MFLYLGLYKLTFKKYHYNACLAMFCDQILTGKPTNKLNLLFVPPFELVFKVFQLTHLQI